MDSRKRISYLQNKISLKDFDINFWESLNKLPDEQLTFDFLFNKSSENLAPFFKICLVIYRGDLKLPKKENFDLTDVIRKFCFKVASSKHLPDKDKTEIIKYADGQVSSTSASAIRLSYVTLEVRRLLIFRSALPDEIFNHLLQSDWPALTRNENLTSKQYVKLLEYILNYVKSDLSQSMLKEIRRCKPEEIKIELNSNWLFLKTCFDLEEPGNATVLKTLLTGVDEETFKVLETSWPGNLKDLLQACLFNGPDK